MATGKAAKKSSKKMAKKSPVKKSQIWLLNVQPIAARQAHF
jgi:hypothetical protein